VVGSTKNKKETFISERLFLCIEWGKKDSSVGIPLGEPVPKGVVVMWLVQPKTKRDLHF
jgi:hypothetical protein